MKELLTLREFKERKLLKEGDYFKLKLGQEHLFQYVEEINDGENVKLLGEPTERIVALEGVSGYRNSDSIINGACQEKFCVPDEIDARSITEEEENSLPAEYRHGSYWIPRVYFNEYKDVQIYSILYCSKGEYDKKYLALNEKNFKTSKHGVKPVITIYGPHVRIVVGKKQNGKKPDTAYEIIIIEKEVKGKEEIRGEAESLTVEEFTQRELWIEGHWFKMHLNPKVSYEVEKIITGYSKVQKIENQEGEKLLARYVKAIDSGKNVRLLGEPSDCVLYLSGKIGYNQGESTIETFCQKKYSYLTEIQASSITAEEQAMLPPKFQYGEYWLPKSQTQNNILGMQIVSDAIVTYICLYKEKGEAKNSKAGTGCDYNSVRPIIELSGKKIRILVGKNSNGRSKETAYEIIIEE